MKNIKSADIEHKAKQLIDRLAAECCLDLESYEFLVCAYNPKLAKYAAELAADTCMRVYGKDIYSRGLIEFSNYCKNNCFYCGLRAVNSSCERYRLRNKEIFACASEGYSLGFRTFVLQSGEDEYYTDEVLCEIISVLKKQHPDCAVTLSLGERSKASYKNLHNAGADRYLLRHETASKNLYERLHPSSMSYENRIKCLYELSEVGFAIGAGFIVGTPYQKPQHLAQDLKFIERLRPQMCGIGPFIPHHATAFAGFAPGSVGLTCYLLSLLRLLLPNLLLPATTALATLAKDGRERGICSGANVVMPNLSPRSVRKKYEIYDNKACTNEEAAQCHTCLKRRIEHLGRNLCIDRGDPKY